MAGVKDDDLLRLGPWPLGANNLAKEGNLPRGESGVPLALREAVNVDIDNEGEPSRRRGYERVYDGTLSHSGWSHPMLPFGLFVDDGELCALFTGGDTEQLGVTVGNYPLSYDLFNDQVFFTNRSTCGMVSQGLEVNAWGPDTPDGQPDLAPLAGYSLIAGKYQVAIAFIDALGRESGSTLAAEVVLPAGHGMQLSNIPQPADSVATPTVVVYVTDADDSVLRRYAKMPAGITTLQITQPAQGRSFTAQFLDTMPAGLITRLLNGRQYVADGRNLRWSPSLRYGLTDPAKHVIRFKEDIQLMEPAGDGAGSGMYVASGNRTIWFGGADPESFSRRIVSNAGAVPGTQCRVPGNVIGLESEDTVSVWLSRHGYYVAGLPSGQLKSLDNKQAVIDQGSRGATLLREQGGIQQFVTTLREPSRHSLAVTDRAIAHVIYED